MGIKRYNIPYGGEDPKTAEGVIYNNSVSGLKSTTVQGAIIEIYNILYDSDLDSSSEE